MRYLQLLSYICVLTLFATEAHAESHCDVLVYGSTPAGFCAAIGASREGCSVILVEPTKHVGGVNTGGLCFSDSNQTVRSTLGGLFEEWHQRIEQDYIDHGYQLPYTVKEKDNKVWTYEPHVAQRITQQMLNEAKVLVITEAALKSVSKDALRLTGMTTTKGDFTARVFIDATYEGDLMAAAGVNWTIGREGKAEFNETLAGKQYPKPRITISGFNDQGNLLPLMTTKDAGEEDQGDKHVMIYSFRLCLTRDPENRVPFPAPANYDPKRFEVVRRYFIQEKKPVLLWDLYALPHDKFDANNGIGKQFSMGLPGLQDGWCEATLAERVQMQEAYKQYTLEMYQFLTTDPAVPANLRQQLATLGLCKDEFGDDHWSPQLYVREGRRMKGMYVLNQNDILTHPHKEDSIGISSFPIDSHDCQRVAHVEGYIINEGTIFPVRVKEPNGITVRGYAYQVPIQSLLPQPTECDNLVVPVGLSATHVAYSSIRVEPTWMMLGHSAGIIAAYGAKQDLALQKIDYQQLKPRLLAQKQILDLPK
jgi:hypothetical protein